jgi:capsular exopolysaccharide synthesis family protein
MLQTTKTPLLEANDTTSPAEVLESLTGLVRRQYPVMVGCVAAALFLGLVYMLITPQSFTAQALVMIDPLRIQLSGAQAVSADAATMSTNVDSQIPVIKSPDIAVPVIKALNLASRPEFAEPGMLAKLLHLPAAAPATEAEHSSEISQTLVDAFEQVLDVQRLGLTYVIRIDFRSTSPELAARVPNLIAETYIHEQQEARYQALRGASAWLQDSIKQLSERASEAEQAFVDFKTQSDLSKESQATFHELESAARTYRSLYESFLHRYGESVEQQSFPVSDARIVSRAVPPERKSRPEGRLTMAIATFAGLLSGLGIAIWRDLSDRTFRTAAQVEAALQTRFVSYVPALGLKRSLLGWSFARRRQGPTHHQQRSWRAVWSRLRRRSTKLAVLCSASIDFPASQFAEAIRSMKLFMELSKGRQKGHVIGITSALPGEGKSAIAVNLARVLARSGVRTILVDCDLHNPELSRTFGGSHPGGLLAGLENTHSLAEGIWNDRETGLAFLSAGVEWRLFQPHDALASEAMGSVFEALRHSYDMIIVDLSSLLPLVDVCLTARFIDRYILIVEWGRTASDVVTHALETSGGIRDKLVGAVLNKTKTNQIRRFQRWAATIDQSRLYARYGYTD